MLKKWWKKKRLCPSCGKMKKTSAETREDEMSEEDSKETTTKLNGEKVVQEKEETQSLEDSIKRLREIKSKELLSIKASYENLIKQITTRSVNVIEHNGTKYFQGRDLSLHTGFFSNKTLELFKQSRNVIRLSAFLSFGIPQQFHYSFSYKKWLLILSILSPEMIEKDEMEDLFEEVQTERIARIAKSKKKKLISEEIFLDACGLITQSEQDYISAFEMFNRCCLQDEKNIKYAVIFVDTHDFILNGYGKPKTGTPGYFKQSQFKRTWSDQYKRRKEVADKHPNYFPDDEKFSNDIPRPLRAWQKACFELYEEPTDDEIRESIQEIFKEKTGLD